MRSFLFLNTETRVLDPGKIRILQLSTRLVRQNSCQDYHQRIRPDNCTLPATATKRHAATDRVAIKQGTALAQVLDELTPQVQQADLLVGHRIESSIAIILAEARHAGRHDLLNLLTPPQFGFAGGQRAAICLQQLAADYLRFLGESPTPPNTSLSTMYQRLFQQELVGTPPAMANVITCQRVYTHLRDFQREHGVDFGADVVCLAD